VNALAAPSTPPLLSSLLGGFGILVAGLAALTLGRRRGPMSSRRSTIRAIGYVMVYALSTGGFMRVLQSALLGHERSPWLLALGDVVFITLGLFVWVMVLAEGYSVRSMGLRPMPAGRLFLTLVMGVGAAAVYSWAPYQRVVTYQVHATPDTLVFALLWSMVGSALPEELLFRGFLMGTLDRRVSQWARVALPALAFTAVRALRFLPGPDLGVPEWLGYIFGVALPMGLWWGILRELGGGAIWPCLISHFLLEFGPTLAGTTPSPL
jgi:membrane protease YdiL (CAAX protease family)